jgi:UDP-hydrolysing UDP-N-acetyl-D-glucosamine 2-epimerase
VHQDALAGVLRKQRTEVVLLLGDRFELLDVALVCLVGGLVIAHCSGGERTRGSFDDAVRDAVTKLAHLHLVAHAEAAQRVAALEEEQWRICVSGEPGLDSVATERCLSSAELEPIVGVAPGVGDCVVAVHPVTRRPEETGDLIAAVEAVAGTALGYLFLSTPNGDPGSDTIASAWQRLASIHTHCVLLPSLGSHAFRSLVAECGLLLGNSSAGLVEAPSLGTPTVDLGTRQEGRVRGRSVISCPVVSPEAVRAAIESAQALRIAGMPLRDENPYGDGHAVPRILDHISAHARTPGVHSKQ